MHYAAAMPGLVLCCPYRRTLKRVFADAAADLYRTVAAGRSHTLRVTCGEAPTTIGAAYNRHNFWNGRANRQFNGTNPFGATGNAGSIIGTLIMNASLASQSVGPPNKPTGMSCANRNESCAPVSGG